MADITPPYKLVSRRVPVPHEDRWDVPRQKITFSAGRYFCYIWAADPRYFCGDKGSALAAIEASWEYGYQVEGL